MTGKADLHLHTTCSDGRRPPAEVVGMAAKAGMQAFAITDHDTVAGIPEAAREAERLGLRLIPGVELSVQFAGCDVHVLGYFIDPQNPELRAMLERQRLARQARLSGMLARLRRLGIPLRAKHVVRKAPEGGPVGRPHIAECLVEQGWVENVQSAFAFYIGGQCPAYLPNQTPSPEQALRTLRQAGGVPVLAHPGTYRLEEVLGRFVPAGLMGLEVYHPRHDEAETARLRLRAAELGLLVTGGSDYHGEGRGDAPPGTKAMDSEQLAALEAAHSKTASGRTNGQRRE